MKKAGSLRLSTAVFAGLLTLGMAGFAVADKHATTATTTDTAATAESNTAATVEITPQAVIKHYVVLATATFYDSLSTAKTLQDKVNAFLAAPSAETHEAAKQAWLAARIPYGQTEVFRFGNANVDDWEGQVNAWPLDEGLIDYVAGDAYETEEGNEFATANMIAGDAPITAESLREWHEKGGSEANVSTGYHALEFLLWGQDFNENPQDRGLRTYTDFVQGDGCTHGNCDRRSTYLKVATDLLVEDLQTMVDDWAEHKDDKDDKNNYRKAFLALDEQEALRRMLVGMGSLSFAELAGERMNVALLAHAQEDEHSCFSDNTHEDIYWNAAGIEMIYTGRYQRPDGTVLEGASLKALLRLQDPELVQNLDAAFADTRAKAKAIVEAAQNGEHFDQQIAAGNEAGNQRIKDAIAALRTQTGQIEAAAGVLNIENLSADEAS